jgi:hypothetical protein
MAGRLAAAVRAVTVVPAARRRVRAPAAWPEQAGTAARVALAEQAITPPVLALESMAEPPGLVVPVGLVARVVPVVRLLDGAIVVTEVGAVTVGAAATAVRAEVVTPMR